jgi:hypothetical protein
MLDDWAFSHPTEATEHRAYSGGNPGLFRMVDRLYQANGGGLGYAYVPLVTYAVGAQPAGLGKVVDTQVAFRGEESGFKEDLDVALGGRGDWEATPMWLTPKQSYDQRKGCFLGLGCGAQP